MNIDKINDIEILKNELKKNMVKCKESFEKDGLKFNKDEYYNVDQDEDTVYLYNDNGEVAYLNYTEAEKYLFG